MMFGAGWELRHMSISELMHRTERARRLEVFTGHELARLRREPRLARRARLPVQEPPVRFVPAVVEAVPGLPPPPASQPQRARRRGPVTGIEVEMDGIVVRIGSGASPQAIAAVIRALKVGP